MGGGAGEKIKKYTPQTHIHNQNVSCFAENEPGIVQNCPLVLGTVQVEQKQAGQRHAPLNDINNINRS